jgi:hypothetical protein
MPSMREEDTGLECVHECCLSVAATQFMVKRSVMVVFNLSVAEMPNGSEVPSVVLTLRTYMGDAKL